MPDQKDEPLARPGPGGDQATGAQDPNAAGDTHVDWRSELPDELKRFAANLASPADAVRMAAALRQKLSRAIVPPAGDAAPEEVAEYRRRLGVPDGPDGYRIRYPELLSPDLLEGPRAALDEAGFREAMHAAGATQEAVQAVVDWYAEVVAGAQSELSEARAAELKTVSEALLREWGNDYERNADLSRRAAMAYGGEDLIRRLEDAGLANDPVVIRAFHRIGREIAEDDVLGDRSAETTRRLLEERARALRRRPDRWTNRQVDQELREIMEQLHGTGPVHPEGS